MLIYDGDCGFCRRTVGWARALGVTCEMRPSAEVDLPALGLTAEDAAAAAWYVDGGRRYAGHEAVAMALRSSRRPVVRLAGRVVGSRPMRPLASRAYAWVAGHRPLLSRLTRR